MRRVLQALEQRAITATKVEVDFLISEASNSIKAYVEDNSNVTELKHSVELLEKTSSTLQVMQIHGGALLASEAVKVIQTLIDGSASRIEEAQDVVSRAIMRLSEYLEHVEAGNKDIPLVLMPLLNDLRASRDAALLSENVLFFPNMDGVQPPDMPVQGAENTQGSWLRLIRTNFQKTLLACVSGKDVSTAAAQLCKLCIRLQRASSTEAGQKLWWLASALSQAVAINAVPFNASIASLFNSLDRHIKLLIDVGEDKFAKNFDENIIKNILYYIAISDDRGRIVNQVKKAYALNEQVPQQQDMLDQRAQVSAPSSEVLINVSKALLEDIASTKDCIELFIHSDLREVKHVDRLQTGLQKICDTLSMIGIDEYRSKVEHQINEVELMQSGEQGDIELSLLGVSEIVLEVETCINNFIEYRINFHDSDVDQFDSGKFSASQDTNEHKAAFSVTVSEVLLRMEQLKEILTEAIHISFDDNKCARAEQNIKEIRGVISVIDLASPLSLLDGVSDYISSSRFKKDVYENGENLRDLADCVVGLQCYFEQLESRAPYADQIIDHCKPALEKILNTNSDQQKESPEESQSDASIDVDFDETMLSNGDEISAGAALILDGVESNLPEMQGESVDALPDLNALVEEIAEPEIKSPKSDSENKTEHEQANNQPSSIDKSTNTGVQEKEVLGAQNEEVKTFSILTGHADPLLVETFIEEAEQVIRDINKYWYIWKSDQKDWQSFADMRRGYHTLKGSGRFVGAELLSEFAWEFENLCNKCLGSKNLIVEEKQNLFQQGADLVPKLVKQLKNPELEQELDLTGLMKQVKLASEDSVERVVISAEKIKKEMPAIDMQEDSVLKDELTGIFTAEATEHLKVMQDALDEEHIKLNTIRIDEELLRTVHTMRGSARTAGVTHISDLCHPLEEIIELAIKHNFEFEGEQIELIQTCVKQIEADLVNINNSKPLSDLDSSLKGKLQKLNEELHGKFLVDQSIQASEKAKSSSSMIDSNEDRDEELCEIFFEEAEDVLAACQGSFLRLKDNINDAEALSELRRQFHTLKGSSRMAGFSTIGELSHVTESLLVSLVDKKVEQNESNLIVLQRVLDELHSNVELAQRAQIISLDDALVAEVQAASGSINEVEEKKVEEKGGHDIDADLPVSELVTELGLDEGVNDEVKSDSDEEKIEEAQSLKSIAHKESQKFINVSKDSTDSDKHEIVRVPADILDVLVNDAGEVNIQRSRLDQVFNAFTLNSAEFEQTIGRLREQLRKLEMETEAQILFKHADDQENLPDFDPLELDRYSDIQQLSRSLAESVDDLSNIKETFLNRMQDGEDVLVRQKVVTASLQDKLLRTRMVKFTSVEARLQRIVRQTSAELKKQVDLVIQGGDNEVDRRVLNGVITSIEHILRNSVVHGIETPDVREKANKRTRGQIKIEIEREGSEINIVIKDDGAGINPGKVKAKAIENGLIKADSQINNEEALQLIFKSGLSTASTVTKVAGRGVGMDIVDKDIRRLGGSIETRSAEGKGAKFILRLPFTLAVSQALLIQAGKEVYALTLSGIEGVIQLSVEELKEIFAHKDPSYTYAGHDYSFHHLATLLQGGSLFYEDETVPYPVILVRIGEHRLALQVEASFGNKEIVVKPLAPHFSQTQGISGATILGNGKVALILDIPWIARLVQTRDGTETIVVSEAPEGKNNEESTVMVVDDSITIRKVTTRFLERNNYKVITAKDGVDALQKLLKVVPDVVLLDIEMPRMDGYELASQMRKDERLSEVPIIMITSRTGDKHRNRALELGVNCYLGKPYNEAQLLERIARY